MKVLGIIPARSGSKRIKDKCVKSFAGKPLIEYTINAAKNSKLLTEIVVSTDSIQYAEIVKKYKVNVPVLRPKRISGDKIPDKPVIEHMLEWFELHENKKFDAVVYLRPTTPFKTGRHIDDIINKAENGNFSSIRSVTKVHGVYHPYWMYTEKNGTVFPLIHGKTAKEYYQSQMLPPVFRLNGVVDLIHTKTLISSDSLYGDNIGMYEIPEEIGRAHV